MTDEEMAKGWLKCECCASSAGLREALALLGLACCSVAGRSVINGGSHVHPE